MDEREGRPDRDRRGKKEPQKQRNMLHEVGPAPEEFVRRPHGPRASRAHAGSGLPMIPLLAGVAALAVVLGFQTNTIGRLWEAAKGGPEHGPPEVNSSAIKQAELAVPRYLKNRVVAAFENVRSAAPNLACGLVDEQTLPGQPVEKRRFIFTAGQVRFDDGSASFAREWAARCGASAPLADVAQIEPRPRHARRGAEVAP